MPWAQWVCCLYKSRQLDEYDRYYQYVLSGGKPEEWTWTYKSDSMAAVPGQTRTNIAGSIMTQWKSAQLQSQGKLVPPLKGNLEEAADRGFVKRATMLEDGTFLDESGNKVEMPPGYFFVPKKASD